MVSRCLLLLWPFLITFVSCEERCSQDLPSIQTDSDMKCAIKCNEEDLCSSFKFEDGVCHMKKVSFNAQISTGPSWMSCIDRKPSLANYGRVDDRKEYFKRQAAAAGFNYSMDYIVSGQKFTKYYKVIRDPSKPTRAQTERGCLSHNGVLPVIGSIEEAKQLAKVLFHGETKVPVGFDATSRMEVRWFDGFRCSLTCPDYVKVNGWFGYYQGILFQGQNCAN